MWLDIPAHNICIQLLQCVHFSPFWLLLTGFEQHEHGYLSTIIKFSTVHKN